MANNLKELSFKVSARTARLIGRENVATSYAAVTELVKNAYDADASMCAVCFLPKYTEIPLIIDPVEYAYLSGKKPDITSFYEKKNNWLQLKETICDTSLVDLKKIFKTFVNLWIIDNGIGMSSRIIEDRWMIIGTNIKDTKTTSASGRVMTGAKGIGRFALDRLSERTDLYSSTADNPDLVHWALDWNAFEGEEKVLDEVKTTLENKHQNFSDLFSEFGLSSIIPTKVTGSDTKSGPLSYRSGTAIYLQHLRDNWNQQNIEKLQNTLEALLPPSDRRDFSIFVYDHRNVDNFGWLDNFPPDQFDYRLQADIKGDGCVEIRLDRHEIEAERISSAFYSLKEVNCDGYTEADFRRGYFSYTTSLGKILNASSNEHLDSFKAVGPFKFNLYYLKLSKPTKDNLEKYPQKLFDASKRRKWMKISGGIRLYRDEFRVRPFGEPGTQSYDWLSLGQRTAQNPGGIGSKGSWRVPPQQVAGTIHITKAYNPLLADQSNREGIMNEVAFTAFRQIIIGLINEFEKDRNRIFRGFNCVYELNNPKNNKLKKAAQIVKQIDEGKDGEHNFNDKEKLEKLKSDRIILAEAHEINKQKEKDLNDEIQLLRGLATLGTVFVSFTHELKQIKLNVKNRYRIMKNSLKKVIDSELLNKIPRQINPYDILERWKREDKSVSNWVDFALSSVSHSKRRRRSIIWQDYFHNFFAYWNSILNDRKIELILPMEMDRKLMVLAHEIDLDSLFYNLIINSIEVLTKPTKTEDRRIMIKHISSNDKEITFEYSDNGPGISKGVRPRFVD